MTQNNALFTEADVIFAYTDDQAVEDGTLIAIDGKNRVTSTVFGFLARHLQKEPPTRWPVELLTYFGSKSPEDRARAAAWGLVTTYGDEARRIYDRNIGGGIWRAKAVVANGRIRELAPEPDMPTGAADAEVRTLWLMPNEVGGLTLLFPDDY